MSKISRSVQYALMSSSDLPVPTTSLTFGTRQNIGLKTRLMYETYSGVLTFLAGEFIMRTQIHHAVMRFAYLSLFFSITVNTTLPLRYNGIPTALWTETRKSPSEN